MRIAVTYENDKVFQHFGHTEKFKLYDAQNDKVTAEEVLNAAGCGHGALAGFLMQHQVDALICGGIGMGTRNAMAEAQIKLYSGVQGRSDDAVKSLISGSLTYNPNVECNHLGHEGEQHRCGEVDYSVAVKPPVRQRGNRLSRM